MQRNRVGAQGRHRNPQQDMRSNLRRLFVFRLALFDKCVSSLVVNATPAPAQLTAIQLETCLAAAERHCRVMFQHKGRLTDDVPGYLFRNSLHFPARNVHMLWANSKYRTGCITAVATAKALVNDSLQERTTLEHQPIPVKYAGDAGSEWRYVPGAVPRNRTHAHNQCLVYAFGVQHSDEFTNFYSAQGCEVFAFDPTVTHYAVTYHTHGKRRYGVTFLSWGLTSTEATYPYKEASSMGPQYGSVVGALYSLPQIVSMLGHRGRTITALKLDCEGCEFAAFRDLWCEEQLSKGEGAPFPPMPVIQITSVVVEAHLLYSEGMPRLATSADVERIRYLGLWLHQHSYKSFQYAMHVGFTLGYRGGVRTVPPDLEAAGIPNDVCCYLIGFVREDLVAQLGQSRGNSSGQI